MSFGQLGVLVLLVGDALFLEAQQLNKPSSWLQELALVELVFKRPHGGDGVMERVARVLENN